MTDFVPETSDDRNSAQSKQTTYSCGHQGCTAEFDTPEELGRHTAQCDAGEANGGN